MQPLIDKLQAAHPQLTFRVADQFCWSPENREIMYIQSADSQTARWALLHETSHALLNHQTYTNDFELIAMEAAAWQHAQQLAIQLGVGVINDNHMQDCLDTYRDWLHKRCLCPTCGTRCLQENGRRYRCHNCGASWQVTPSRFCRAYRRSGGISPLLNI